MHVSARERLAAIAITAFTTTTAAAFVLPRKHKDISIANTSKDKMSASLASECNEVKE